MKHLYLCIVSVVCCLVLVSCSKPHPCMKKWECTDCHCLFDALQKAQADITRYHEVKSCYEQACKE